MPGYHRMRRGFRSQSSSLISRRRWMRCSNPRPQVADYPAPPIQEPQVLLVLSRSLSATERDEIMGHGGEPRMDHLVVHREQEDVLEVAFHQLSESAFILAVDVALLAGGRCVRL